MNHKVVQEVHKCIKKYEPQGIFLLALSGGPDSIALFYALKQLRLPFEVAHVDHCWREEAKREADLLEELCKSESIPFHLKTLSPSVDERNLEERGREARYRFFREVMEKSDCKTLLTGHHADDQAETVLKRLFESSHIVNLQGIRQYCPPTCRPLLNVRKKEIIHYLQENRRDYFTDETNLDSRFLRGKLRGDIIPALSEKFGKEITPSLLYLSAQIAQLEEYMNKKSAYLRDLVEGNTLDLSQVDVDPFELDYFLSREALARGTHISREGRCRVVEALMSKKGGVQVGPWSVKRGKLVMD